MAGDTGSNSVSIVAILAILVLVGVVIYLVFRPANDAELELDVDISDEIGLLVPAPSSFGSSVTYA